MPRRDLDASLGIRRPSPRILRCGMVFINLLRRGAIHRGRRFVGSRGTISEPVSEAVLAILTRSSAGDAVAGPDQPRFRLIPRSLSP